MLRRRGARSRGGAGEPDAARAGAVQHARPVPRAVLPGLQLPQVRGALPARAARRQRAVRCGPCRMAQKRIKSLLEVQRIQSSGSPQEAGALFCTSWSSAFSLRVRHCSSSSNRRQVAACGLLTRNRCAFEATAAACVQVQHVQAPHHCRAKSITRRAQCTVCCREGASPPCTLTRRLRPPASTQQIRGGDGGLRPAQVLLRVQFGPAGAERALHHGHAGRP